MPTYQRSTRTRRPTRARLAAWSVVACIGACAPRSASESPAPTTPSIAVVETTTEDAPKGLDGPRLLGLLDELASDELGGRYTLHDDIRRAAESITARYREAGVEPGTAAGYAVDFEVVVGVDAGPDSRLELRGRALPPETFVPRPEGGAGEAEGPLVFVGYGIALDDAADVPFDELAGVELEGAVAVVMTTTSRSPSAATTRRSTSGGSRPCSSSPSCTTTTTRPATRATGSSGRACSRWPT